MPVQAPRRVRAVVILDLRYDEKPDSFGRAFLGRAVWLIRLCCLPEV